MLDSGFTGILCVNSNYSENHQLPTKLKKFSTEASTDGGGVSADHLFVTAPRLLFANESMPLLPILLDINSSSVEWRQTFDGIIGYDVLKRFRMIWDYDNMSITLSPGFNYFSPITSINQD